MTTENTTSDNLPKQGVYKARAIKGSEQYGESSNKNQQIYIDFKFPELNRQYTIILSLSPAAYPYSIQRLRALGWDGDRISDLTGIDKNEVDVDLTHETWEGKQQVKLNIRSGGGRIVAQNPVDPKAFEAKFNALTGLQATPPAAGAPKPKF
jgi:hypothetical protein